MTGNSDVKRLGKGVADHPGGWATRALHYVVGSESAYERRKPDVGRCNSQMTANPEGTRLLPV
jgi:hypothetical protein